MRARTPGEYLDADAVLSLPAAEYHQLCGVMKPGQLVDPWTNKTEEIDECRLMPQMCSHGVCLNVPGSFECECHRGYVYDLDSHQCIGEATARARPGSRPAAKRLTASPSAS